MSAPGVSGGNLFRARPYSHRETSPVGVPLRATGVSPTIEESWALRELALESGTVLEVGTAWGYSSILMALAGAMVYTVDPHLDHGTWDEFQRNLDTYKVRTQVTAYHEPSQARLPRMIAAGVRFDAAFIDGDHSYEACRHDLERALQLVKPGGLLAAHDYSAAWPGVFQACDEVLGEFDTRRVVETLLIVRLSAGWT